MVSEASHLAEALEGLFATPNLFWFVSFPDAVEGLTCEQAAAVPGPRFNSVWGVTLHLTLCQQFALAVLSSQAVEAGTFFAEGAWPPVHDPQDAEAWQKAKAGLLAVNQALAENVAGLSPEALEQELPAVGMKAQQYILGHLAHNSNHINEIVSIRHMQGFWLEKT
jgi:hypothetical protein